MRPMASMFDLRKHVHVGHQVEHPLVGKRALGNGVHETMTAHSAHVCLCTPDPPYGACVVSHPTRTMSLEIHTRA